MTRTNIARVLPFGSVFRCASRPLKTYLTSLCRAEKVAAATWKIEPGQSAVAAAGKPCQRGKVVADAASVGADAGSIRHEGV